MTLHTVAKPDFFIIKAGTATPEEEEDYKHVLEKIRDRLAQIEAGAPILARATAMSTEVHVKVEALNTDLVDLRVKDIQYIHDSLPYAPKETLTSLQPMAQSMESLARTKTARGLASFDLPEKNARALVEEITRSLPHSLSLPTTGAIQRLQSQIQSICERIIQKAGVTPTPTPPPTPSPTPSPTPPPGTTDKERMLNTAEKLHQKLEEYKGTISYIPEAFKRGGPVDTNHHIATNATDLSDCLKLFNDITANPINGGARPKELAEYLHDFTIEALEHVKKLTNSWPRTVDFSPITKNLHAIQNGTGTGRTRDVDPAEIEFMEVIGNIGETCNEILNELAKLNDPSIVASVNGTLSPDEVEKITEAAEEINGTLAQMIGFTRAINAAVSAGNRSDVGNWAKHIATSTEKITTLFDRITSINRGKTATNLAQALKEFTDKTIPLFPFDPEAEKVVDLQSKTTARPTQNVEELESWTDQIKRTSGDFIQELLKLSRINGSIEAQILSNSNEINNRLKDIHGNLPLLKVVIQNGETAKYQQIITVLSKDFDTITKNVGRIIALKSNRLPPHNLAKPLLECTNDALKEIKPWIASVDNSVLATSLRNLQQVVATSTSSDTNPALDPIAQEIKTTYQSIVNEFKQLSRVTPLPPAPIEEEEEAEEAEKTEEEIRADLQEEINKLNADLLSGLRADETAVTKVRQYLAYLGKVQAAVKAAGKKFAAEEAVKTVLKDMNVHGLDKIGLDLAKIYDDFDYTVFERLIKRQKDLEAKLIAEAGKQVADVEKLQTTLTQRYKNARGQTGEAALKADKVYTPLIKLTDRIRVAITLRNSKIKELATLLKSIPTTLRGLKFDEARIAKVVELVNRMEDTKNHPKALEVAIERLTGFLKAHETITPLIHRAEKLLDEIQALNKKEDVRAGLMYLIRELQLSQSGKTITKA